MKTIIPFLSWKERFFPKRHLKLALTMLIAIIQVHSAFGQAPSTILPDIVNFKLEFPLDPSGNDYTGVSYNNRETPLIKNEIETSLGGYIAPSPYSDYFYVSGNEVVFKAHCAGALTSANAYPRCELRERPGGSDTFWEYSDEQELNATFKITHLPNLKKEVCVLQLKGNTSLSTSGTSEVLRLEYNAGNSQLLHLVWNENNTISDIMPYSLGQTIKARIYVNNGTVTVDLENVSTGDTYNYQYGSAFPYGYFKAGCYTQSSIWVEKNGVGNELPTAYGEVRFSELTLGVQNNPGSLPSPWLTSDVGSVGSTGGASYSNGTFSVEGSGSDIWGASDEFRYVYQTLAGDGEIIARVNSITNTNQWAKAGVMFRESLDNDSKHAMSIVTPSKGVSFQRRTADGGSSSHNTISGQSAPKWLRMVRSGNDFSAYYSSNGSSWTQIGSDVTISMGTSVFVGLCVTSHNDGVIATADIDNVTVSSTSAGCTPILPANRSATNVGSSNVTLSWDYVSSMDHYNVRYRPTGSSSWTNQNSLNTGSVTITGLSSNTTYEWQVRAKCSDGSGTSYSAGQGPNFTTSGGGGACNPATPTNLSITNVGSEAVELSWNSNPSIDHYNIRYKKVVNTDWVYIYSISGTATSTVLSGVINNGTQYEWQIRAKCSDGSGSSYTDGQGPNFTPSSSSMVVYGSGIIGTSLSSIEPKLDVYPNPFTSDLTIQVQGVDDIQTTTLKMYSIDGSLVYEKSNLNSGSTIHLNLEIERGIYMLHWFDRDGNLLRSNKLIKSH